MAMQTMPGGVGFKMLTHSKDHRFSACEIIEKKAVEMLIVCRFPL